MTEVSVEKLWAKAVPDDRGLLPCVAQDLRTRAVLMVAWVSKDALAKSLETGYATYYSRSRQELWEKGAVSGNRQRVLHIRLDCDGDTLLYLVEAKLPACHEGTDTCFSWRRVGEGWARDPIDVTRNPDADVMNELETVIDARANAKSDMTPSYTRSLLDAGAAKIALKIREEADETGRALTSESDERVVAESADLLYHLAVGLKGRNLSFRQVLMELERRMGTSGITEKAARGLSEAINNPPKSG